MNTYVQDLLYDALLSGRYAQTAGVLRMEDAFCFSGVLCDLHRQITGFEWEIVESAYGEVTWTYLGATANLPAEVLQWAQVTEEDIFPFQDANDSGEDFATLAHRLLAL